MANWEEYQKKIDNSLPDWCCAIDYKHFSIDTSNEQYAWEFLRRNKDFQLDYFKAILDQENNKDFKFPLHKWGLKELSTRACPSNTTSPGFYINRFPIVKFKKKKSKKLLKYIEDHPHDDEVINYKIQHYQKEIKEPKKLTLIMKFSVAWDIDSQLETAKKLLNKHKEFIEYTRINKIALEKLDENPNKGSFKYYLRAFDALYYKKATLKETAIIIKGIDLNKSVQSLASAKKTVKTQADNGYNLVNFGYKNILNIGTRSDN